jgi:hypothetical protein
VVDKAQQFFEMPSASSNFRTAFTAKANAMTKELAALTSSFAAFMASVAKVIFLAYADSV